MKTLDIDLGKIIVLQNFGYPKQYKKEAPIKHRRKKINDINYSTKKMQLIFYRNEFINTSNFNICFIYKSDDKHFIRRVFTSMSETFELISKDEALIHFNNDTLF